MTDNDDDLRFFRGIMISLPLATILWGILICLCVVLYNLIVGA